MPWKQQGGGNGGGPWGGGGGQGGGGGGQGPWGGGGQSGPPDFEGLIRKGQDRVRQFLPGGLGGFRTVLLIVLLAVLVWMLTGLYRVQPGEKGVELLFGRFVKTTDPGLNFWAPWPLGSVVTPNVERTNQLNIGFRALGAGSRNVNRTESIRDVAEESLMLTSDQNIIDIDFVVQWRIGKPRDFLYNIRDPQQTIKRGAESSIREIVGQTPLEETLATKRQEVEVRTKDVLQRILDDYKAGVIIAEIKLQKVDPPQKVIDAFNDVQRARQDKERQENEANAYRNDILPKAKGEAERLRAEAEAYREQLIKEADGEAKRFISVYDAYMGGRDVTLRRLYLERMQEVMKNSEKVIIDRGQGGVVPYLPLPELRKRAQGASQ